MRDLLVELGVPDPERDYFYSSGSTVTEAAISSALQALRGYKDQVRLAAQSVIDLTNR
jgi:hypothetical protein